MNLNVHLIDEFQKEYKRWIVYRNYIKWSYGIWLYQKVFIRQQWVINNNFRMTRQTLMVIPRRWW